MLRKIKYKSIFDLFLSFVFYLQILGINIFSSIYIWIPNIVILLLIASYIISLLKLKIKKLWMPFIFIFYWILTDIFLFILDFSSIGYSQLAIGNFLLITFQLPILTLILYYIFLEKTSLNIFSKFSFFISLFLYSIWYLQLIEDFKYQIIGNISLFSLLIFQKKYFLKNINFFNITIQLVLLFIIVTVGSRQSFVGLVFFFIILIINQPIKKFMYYTFFLISISIISFYSFNLNELFLNESYFLNTINRFSANLDFESSSNFYRIESAKNLINNFSFLPKGYSYTSDFYFLEPHNLFLEIIYLKGYLLGGILVFIILLLIIDSTFFCESRFIRMTILVLLIPAMVSYSLHAARFFIIGILLLLIKKSDIKSQNTII